MSSVDHKGVDQDALSPALSAVTDSPLEELPGRLREARSTSDCLARPHNTILARMRANDEHSRPMTIELVGVYLGSSVPACSAIM